MKKNLTVGIMGHPEVVESVLLNLPPKFTVRRFTDEIKRHVCAIFPNARSISFQSPLNMDSYVEDMRSFTGLPVQEHQFEAVCVEQLEDAYANYYIKPLDDSYWIKALMNLTKSDRISAVPVDTIPQASALFNDGAFLVRAGACLVPYPCHFSFDADGSSVARSLDKFADDFFAAVDKA